MPRAGSYLEPSVETILSLRPGVVLGVPTPSNRVAVERLRTLGVPPDMDVKPQIVARHSDVVEESF